MPKPKPTSESRDEFISRFMSSAEARRDYPDQGQRYAVAASMWRRARRAEKSLPNSDASGRVTNMDHQVEKTCEVAKVDPDQRLVYGWAWVNKMDGELVFDDDGQAIETDDLRKAFHDFMINVRKAGTVHMRDPSTGEKIRTGDVVECLIIDDAVRKALQIGDTREGAFIVAKISDDAEWNLVKSMKHVSFSIGGKAAAVDYAE